MKVRPYQIDYPDGSFNAFGATPQIALESAIRAGVLHDYNRPFTLSFDPPNIARTINQFMQQQPEARLLLPYLMDRKGERKAVFATSWEHAQKILPGRDCHPCDPLMPLRDTGAWDLFHYCLHVWCNRKKDRVGMWQVLPSVRETIRIERVGRRLKARCNFEQQRLVLAHCLRLAITVDLYPSQFSQVSKLTVAEVTNNENISYETEASLEHFRNIHAPNIGQRATEEFIDSIGTDLDNKPRNHKRILHLACKMARFYGYNPNTMTYNELSALYRGGVPELKNEQQDRLLGIDDQWTKKPN